MNEDKSTQDEISVREKIKSFVASQRGKIVQLRWKMCPVRDDQDGRRGDLLARKSGQRWPITRMLVVGGRRQSKQEKRGRTEKTEGETAEGKERQRNWLRKEG